MTPSKRRDLPWPHFCFSWNSLKQALGLARRSRKPCVWRAGTTELMALCAHHPHSALAPNSQGYQDMPTSPYLPVWCRDETQKLIHMAHSQPVHKELHQGLYLLGTEEVSHHPRDSAASRPGMWLGKDTKLNTHSTRNGQTDKRAALPSTRFQNALPGIVAQT